MINTKRQNEKCENKKCFENEKHSDHERFQQMHTGYVTLSKVSYLIMYFALKKILKKSFYYTQPHKEFIWYLYL